MLSAHRQALNLAIFDKNSGNHKSKRHQANFAIFIEIHFKVVYEMGMIKPSQCRAARALLDWSQQQLADAAKVGNATIRNFEGESSSQPRHATLDVIRRALEDAGVDFIPENGGGAGVRLRKRDDGGA